MKKTLLIALILSIAPVLSAEDQPEEEKAPANPVVVMKTSMGDIEIELFQKDAPETVANFIGLAEGTKEWKDAKTGEMVMRPFYDGLAFHRIIKDFMIQGGCPEGNGRGGPGYSFKDEINAAGLGLDKIKVVENERPHPWLLIRSQADFQRVVYQPLFVAMGIRSQADLDAKREEVRKAVEALTLMSLYESQGYVYDEKLGAHKPVKGVIAMANSGPNTNGSQFFINLKDTPHLTGKHTVFGRVVKGMDVVEKCGEVKVDGSAKPLEDVKIISIRVKE